MQPTMRRERNLWKQNKIKQNPLESHKSYSSKRDIYNKSI